MFGSTVNPLQSLFIINTKIFIELIVLYAFIFTILYLISIPVIIVSVIDENLFSEINNTSVLSIFISIISSWLFLSIECLFIGTLVYFNKSVWDSIGYSLKIIKEIKKNIVMLLYLVIISNVLRFGTNNQLIEKMFDLYLDPFIVPFGIITLFIYFDQIGRSGVGRVP
jgi:hypothetical protein